jgi:hypothetical protein
MSPLVAAPLSAVRPEAIGWLWGPYLPRGKLAVLSGDPGVGKSLLTIDLAARLSRPGYLPDGSPVERPHTTLILSAEDDAADTIRPRAEAAGADLERVVVVTAAAGEPLYFPARVAALEDLIAAHRADLVVIDPVTAFLPPEAAANVDQCVRRALTPLATLAARTDCTVQLVRHLRKSGAARAVYRGLGSIGVSAAARVELLAGRHPADPTRCVLASPKGNLAAAVPPLGYRVKAGPGGHPEVEWLGPAGLTAEELALPPAIPLRPRDRAAEWLRAELAGGPRRATDVLAAAAGAGIPDSTLERAKASLGVKSQRVGRTGEAVWYWFDPAAPWPADAPIRKPFELPPLDPL